MASKAKSEANLSEHNYVVNVLITWLTGNNIVLIWSKLKILLHLSEVTVLSTLVAW